MNPAGPPPGGPGAPDEDAVRRRVMRQLIESLVYEGILGADGAVGAGVVYCWSAQRRFSFDRVRLAADRPVVRVAAGEGAREALSPRRFVEDLGPELGPDAERRRSFAAELLQTVLNDSAARRHWTAAGRPAAGASFDDLESLVVDGHRYHPSYKSRIGFNAVDNAEYGPEFARPVRPVWVAVRRDLVEVSARSGSAPDVVGDHVVVPVHPWQWRRHGRSTWAPLLADGAIVPLGAGEDDYRAQQSIRSLANASRPEGPTLKLALSIVNTSTARTLAPHTVVNAAPISEWLRRIVAGDRYLGGLRPVLLAEIRGVAHSPELAAIWRESLHPHLGAEEQAAPFTALTHVDAGGEPFIAAWVKEQGTEAWIRQLLEVTVPPVLHFLVAHGIALEAHAQNLILIHEDGRPRRLALRDFHDGLRYSPDGLADSAARPALRPTPPGHLRVNRNSYLEADSDDDVRDFAHDCLFFVNLAELAMFLEDRFDLAEERFWSLARGVVERHRRRFPELTERARRFDVLAPEVAVEQLTTRRLRPDSEVRLQRVRNPLSLVDAD